MVRLRLAALGSMISSYSSQLGVLTVVTERVHYLTVKNIRYEGKQEQDETDLLAGNDRNTEHYSEYRKVKLQLLG